MPQVRFSIEMVVTLEKETPITTDELFQAAQTLMAYTDAVPVVAFSPVMSTLNIIWEPPQ